MARYKTRLYYKTLCLQTKEELQSILKDFHYESDTEQMSKDVVVALENLVGELK